MKWGLLAVAASVTVFGMLAGLAAARATSTVAMSAHLTVAKLAAKQMPNASGRFTGTLLRYSNGQSKLTWKLTFANLGARATEAQLVAPATKRHPGKVSVLLCRPCRSGVHRVASPIPKFSTKALLTRSASVVVYTKKYAKGVLRGRIVRSG